MSISRFGRPTGSWARGAAGGGGPPALNGSVQADGFQWVSPTTPPTYAPDSSPETMTWTTEGFTTAGAATTYSRALTKTQRVRQPYPLDASLTPFNVALSDYVYATCTSSGVTNNSTMVSPQPVANWILPHRTTVADTIKLEITAHHRDAQSNSQIACVIFSAFDGTTTVTQTVSLPTISTFADDLVPVEVYACDLDVSTLAQGLIRVNAKVYPWYGVAASVNDSALNGTSERAFTERYYRRDSTGLARGINPPLAYVNTAGNDATGIYHTNPATASATPFSTIGGALTGMTAARNTAVTGGICDGCEIRIGAGIAHANTSLPASARPQNISALTITRDPAVSRANAQFIIGGSTNFRSRVGQSGLNAALTTSALHLKDISIVRSTTGNFAGETSPNMSISFIGCNIDNGTQSSVWISAARLFIYGLTATNMTTALNPLASVVANFIGCIRAYTGNSTITTGTEGWLVVGCILPLSTALTTAAGLAVNGSIRFANRFTNNYWANGATFAFGFSVDTTGAVFSSNVLECLDATGNSPNIGVSHDNATADTSHVIMHNNTCTGFDIYSRTNLFYDDGGTARTNVLQSIKGNIFVSMNTKGDVYELDGARVGNWGFLYGVGCQGNMTQYAAANGVGFGGSFSQEYPGLGCNYGTSQTVRNDPLFVNYQGTTGPPATAGAGGGDYAVTSSSPAKGMVSNAMFRYDNVGAARLATGDTAGAYKAP